ncbi:MBL fold metallo-hydrolase [Herpetosiphon giganteus]|uniref:MBL fold metallo-hydrolase n=1 Tax=Herpetosiphon giganteus TaxID=2029754 RepID=UPI0019571E0E|nr:glyoxylase-like metal-dependent hydrolase (beta-lactamase superfamily II) [Herpetosiphon giganteus]
MEQRVLRFETQAGVRIYSLPVEVFPQFYANVYLVVADSTICLIDTGSGHGNSNRDLLAGFVALQDQWGERLSLADVNQIILTHAHIDHFGGLPFVRQFTQAPTAIHIADRRVITNYDGRLLFASKALSRFLRHAGVSAAQHQHLMGMYLQNKEAFQTAPIEQTFEDGDRLCDLFDVVYTPGHCPGQVCLRLDEVLFSADHILARTAPHLAPEMITPGTGLEHYIWGLQQVARLDGIELTLGGHEQPIENLPKRLEHIFASNQRKIERISDLLKAQPQTVAQLSASMYRGLQGYDELLGIEKVGAFVEYLYLRGYVRPVNIAPDDDDRDPINVVYELF